MLPSTPAGAQPRVVDQPVEGPEFGAQRTHERRYRLEIREVERPEHDRADTGSGGLSPAAVSSAVVLREMAITR